MMTTLNIGLWINGKANSNIGPRTVISDVVELLKPSTIDATRRYAKSGEPIMVIKVEVSDETDLVNSINRLCALLQQDCVAGVADGEGFLIGPNTEPYGGEFNPEYFITD